MEINICGTAVFPLLPEPAASGLRQNSAGFAGLTYAMNWYGKKTDKNNADLETIVAKTFTQFAAFTIRGTILRDVTEISRTVRVPLSQLNAEKKDTGYITKNNTKTIINTDTTNKIVSIYNPPFNIEEYFNK